MENRIASALKSLQNEGHLAKTQYDFLMPVIPPPPPDVQPTQDTRRWNPYTPMRPIVSTIGSPSYKLAKELARILTPLTRNTSHAVDIIRRTHPEDLQISLMNAHSKWPEILEITFTMADKTPLQYSDVCSLHLAYQNNW